MIICFFGDSHTETEWNDDGSPALVPGLAKRFPDFQLMNKGVSGYTTRDALKRFEQDVLKHRPDWVVIWFGSNDAGHHREVTLKEYEQNLKTIIGRLSPPKVLLLGTVPVEEAAQFPKRDNQTLEVYNETARIVAVELGCHFLNLFQLAKAKADYFNCLKEDGLHFNAAGYRWLIQVVGDELEKIIKQENR